MENKLTIEENFWTKDLKDKKLIKYRRKLRNAIKKGDILNIIFFKTKLEKAIQNINLSVKVYFFIYESSYYNDIKEIFDVNSKHRSFLLCNHEESGADHTLHKRVIFSTDKEKIEHLSSIIENNMFRHKVCDLSMVLLDKKILKQEFWEKFNYLN